LSIFESPPTILPKYPFSTPPPTHPPHVRFPPPSPHCVYLDFSCVFPGFVEPSLWKRFFLQRRFFPPPKFAPPLSDFRPISMVSFLFIFLLTTRNPLSRAPFLFSPSLRFPPSWTFSRFLNRGINRFLVLFTPWHLNLLTFRDRLENTVFVALYVRSPLDFPWSGCFGRSF